MRPKGIRTSGRTCGGHRLQRWRHEIIDIDRPASRGSAFVVTRRSRGRNLPADGARAALHPVETAAERIGEFWSYPQSRAWISW
jgi:hypothetical protein